MQLTGLYKEIMLDNSNVNIKHVWMIVLKSLLIDVIYDVIFITIFAVFHKEEHVMAIR